jgi:tetratricopeptide (TPR) repeat protein
MAQTRIEIFKEMLKDQPEDLMIWYGLGNEYFNQGKWNESAEALSNVIRFNPDYTAAYQMLGSALLNAGKRDEARSIWQKGIETAQRTGAWKAKQHMEGLLAGVKENEGGFCE